MAGSVVLGASGGLGAAIVRILAERGEEVRAAVRRPAGCSDLSNGNVEIVPSDAAHAASLEEACRGTTRIFHCVNVPYSRWTEALPGINRNILEVARRNRATLVFPGNVYGYGPFQSLPVREDHPRAATGPKGRLRNDTEEAFLKAHESGEIRLVLPRLPDFYGPNVTNPLFGGIFRAALDGKKAYWPGNLDQPHDLIFITDAAQATVLLSETPGAEGQTWHVPGPGPVTGREFLTLVFQAAGGRPRIGVWKRNLLRIIGFFQPDVRELDEILHQFERPYVLDGSKFAARFPDFRFTPHERAVRETLDWFRTH